MTEIKSEWQTRDLSIAYLQGVRGAIPGADLQLAVLAKIAQLWCPKPSRILDIGCGDGMVGRFLMNMYPEVHATFVDFSDHMLNAARDQLNDNKRAVLFKGDFGTPEWLKDIKGEAQFDIVVSGFAIHHRPDARKKELYAEVLDLLSPGGIFVNLDHVSSLTSSGEELFDDFFIDSLHRFHRTKAPNKTRHEVAETYYNRPDKKENILASADVQCEWLRQVGFIDVDCFFKVFELALFGGRKSSNKADADDGR